MKKLLLRTMILLCALIVGTSAWAVEVIHYTLDGTNNSSGGNNAYAEAGDDVVQSEMHWSVVGNATTNPWRIGGKNLSGVDRTIHSKTAMGAAITKVTIDVSNASSITVNSLKLFVYNNSDLEAGHQVDEITGTFKTNSTITFNPTSGTEWVTGAYYKIVFNVSVSGNTNRYVEFKNAKFYKESSEIAITEISLPQTADVPVGKTTTLTATVTPDNHTGTVDWESDDTSIATVTSEGVVTGVAAGSTTIRAKSHADNTINAECTVTVNEDIATLPFIWAGGLTSNLTALYGVTGNSLGDYTDNDSNRPYLVQFNAVGDYIQIRTNGQPGIVAVGVKMIGGNTTSKIKIQESSDGSDFTDVQELTISGNQNDVVNLVTTKAFKSASRYVRIYKSVHNSGGNIGVGPISIAIPEPSAPVDNGDNTITITTSDNMAGWRAFYDASQDYEVDANTKIYVAKAKAATAGEVELTALSATEIPHGEPVILKTSAPNHEMVLTETTGAASLGTNLFAVTDGTNNVDGYRLGYGEIGGSDAVGFFKYTTTTAPAAGIVYIDKNNVNTAASARGLSISFADDETTGVNEVKTQKAAGEYFNLAGQRVSNPTKGLYIVNGKKVIIK